MEKTKDIITEASEKQIEKANPPSTTDNAEKSGPWPMVRDRQRLRWFPARQRLIGLVRGSRDAYVLPPAVIRKACWRE